MEPTSNLIESVSGTVGHGQIGLAGRMGYPTHAGDHVVHPAFLKGWDFISGHADSHADVTFRRPVELVGFLNPTARLDPANPVEFWADHNYVGACVRPGDVTRTVKLDAGPHRLDAWALGQKTDWRHSVWALRAEAGSTQPSPSKKKQPTTMATAESLAVVTAACYPPRQAIDVLRPLAMSAAKRDVHLSVFGIDEQYCSHTTTKVHRLRHWLDALPDRVTHVLWIDGRDVLLQGGSAEICRAYTDLGSPIVSGAERWFSPVSGPEWEGRVAAVAAAATSSSGEHIVGGGRISLNAGCLMGGRAALADALEFLAALWCYFEHQLPRRVLPALSPTIDLDALAFCERYCRASASGPVHHNDQFLS